MSDFIPGHEKNPAQLLENAFSIIAEGEMSTLPFYRAQIPVRACGFTLFEQQWCGVMLTPWMLSLVILPGPQQFWQRKAVGEKLALELPCGNVTFTVSELAGCGQYLSRSLKSPLDEWLDMNQALALAEESARMALTVPVTDSDAPANPARRVLFWPRAGKQPHA